MTIYEQVDLRCGCRRLECTTPYRYSWMLSRGYNTRTEMARWGWKWIKGSGCRGVFVTNDPAAVDRARAVLRLDAPVSNGSHERMEAPMHDVYAARQTLIREYASAGLDARVEIDGFDNLTAEQLTDEITYLSDYTG